MIWFSFSLRASRERFAATLFFFLLDQYLSSWGESKEGKQGEAVKEKDPFSLSADEGPTGPTLTLPSGRPEQRLSWPS